MKGMRTGKSYLAILIIFLLTMLISVSSAENESSTFVLRNGIIFGDSKETVEEKEVLALTLNVSEEGVESLHSDNTIIAGVEDSVVSFKFDDNRLTQMTYSFRTHLSGDIDAIALLRALDFDNIDDGLTLKYGEPMADDAEFSDIDSEMQVSMDGLIALQALLSKGKNNSIGKTGTERVIVFDDGIIKIEHYIFVIGDDYTLHHLQYNYYTNEQIGRKQAPRDPGQDVTDDL